MQGRVRPVLHWIVWWVALAGLWLLLAGNTKQNEVLVGICVAGLAASAARIVERERRLAWAPRGRWLLAAWRPLLRLVVDTGIVATVLWRRVVLRKRVEGRLRAVRFTTTGDDPSYATARVLTKGLASLAPNTYVVSIDDDDEVMLVHQLVRTDDSRDLDPLDVR